MKNGVKMDNERAHKERRPSPEPGQSTGKGSHLISGGGWLVSMLQDHSASMLCAMWWVLHCKQFRIFYTVLEWESAVLKV